MASRTKAQIQKQITALRKECDRIEVARFQRVAVPKLKRLAAKRATFVYRDNSFGDGERWDTYFRVLEVAIGNGSASVLCEHHEIDSWGGATLSTKIKFVTNVSQADAPISGGVPCSEDEYNSSRKRVMAEFDCPAALREYVDRT